MARGVESAAMRPRVLACRNCLDLHIGQVDDRCPCGRGLLVVPDAHYYAALQRRDEIRLCPAEAVPAYVLTVAVVSMVTGAVVAWLLI